MYPQNQKTSCQTLKVRENFLMVSTRYLPAGHLSRTAGQAGQELESHPTWSSRWPWWTSRMRLQPYPFTKRSSSTPWPRPQLQKKFLYSKLYCLDIVVRHYCTADWRLRCQEWFRASSTPRWRPIRHTWTTHFRS